MSTTLAMATCSGALLSNVAASRRVRHDKNNRAVLGSRLVGTGTVRRARAATVTMTPRCAATPVGGDNARASSGSLNHVRELLPSTHRSDPQLVATIAVNATPAPPAAAEQNSSFVTFCRSNWPIFLLLETTALVGAAYSGVSSRNKRLEISKLNDKLRAMMDKMEDANCTFDWSVDEDEEDSWPGSKELSEAKKALEADDVNAALAAFAAAKAAVIEYSGPELQGMDGKAAASWWGFWRLMDGGRREDGGHRAPFFSSPPPTDPRTPPFPFIHFIFTSVLCMNMLLFLMLVFIHV